MDSAVIFLLLISLYKTKCNQDVHTRVHIRTEIVEVLIYRCVEENLPSGAKLA